MKRCGLDYVSSVEMAARRGFHLRCVGNLPRLEAYVGILGKGGERGAPNK